MPDLHWLVQRPRLTAVTWVLHAVVDVTTILTMLELRHHHLRWFQWVAYALVVAVVVTAFQWWETHRPLPPAPGRTSRAEGSGR
ncbi:hypothetical protein [Angustibacter aerolatus]